MEFSLSKGVKIWMAFNRELYFGVKTLYLIVACAYATVTIILRANCESDFKNVLLLLFAMHIIDIVGYIVDLLGFANKNLNFYAAKCCLDVPSVIINIAIQVIFFRALITDESID